MKREKGGIETMRGSDSSIDGKDLDYSSKWTGYRSPDTNTEDIWDTVEAEIKEEKEKREKGEKIEECV